MLLFTVGIVKIKITSSGDLCQPRTEKLPVSLLVARLCGYATGTSLPSDPHSPDQDHLTSLVKSKYLQKHSENVLPNIALERAIQMMTESGVKVYK